MKTIPLGTVVHDKDGHPWVYVGYRVTAARTTRHHFVQSVPYKTKSFPDWQYSAVKDETLINKFPDLAGFAGEET